jgi:hypothetical protein
MVKRCESCGGTNASQVGGDDAEGVRARVAAARAVDLSRGAACAACRGVPQRTLYANIEPPPRAPDKAM